jgi:hypothetical protein
VETDIEMLPVRLCRKLLMAADEEQLQEDAPNSTFLKTATLAPVTGKASVCPKDRKRIKVVQATEGLTWASVSKSNARSELVLRVQRLARGGLAGG